MPPVDPDSFGFLVTDLSRLIRAEMDRRIAEAGLGVTPGEWRALSHAARMGEARQAVLAEQMGLEAMTVSAYLDRLEAQGLVERLPDPADRRAKLVRITPRAAAMLEQVAPIAASVRAEAQAGIAAEHWTVMLEALKRARANLAALRAAAAGGDADAQ